MLPHDGNQNFLGQRKKTLFEGSANDGGHFIQVHDGFQQIRIIQQAPAAGGCLTLAART